MLDTFPNWRNKPHSLDIQYTEAAEVPLLVSLIHIHGHFWDGEYWYRLTRANYVWKWPDWRNHYAVSMEKG